MKKTIFLLVAPGFLLLLPLTASAGDWTGSGPFATGLGNRVITALAVSADGSMIYAGTGSGTVFSLALPPPDNDGDGVADSVDNCPAVSNANQSDVNNNGIGDACDTGADSDYDGLSDAAEVVTYHTSPNNPDTDNDGVGDGQEVSNGSDPLVSNNGSFNPAGTFHGGILLDAAVVGGGNQITSRQNLTFNGTVVGSYEVLAVSAGAIGATGEVRVLPNPDHTFRVFGTDFTGVTANDQSLEVLGDLDKGDDTLALQINGKKSSGMGSGDLLGDYVFAELHDASVSTTPTIVARRLALGFNGFGTVTYSTLADSSLGNAGGSGAYAVSGDGTLDLLGTTGFVSPDGQVIVAVDTAVDANPAVDDDIYLGVGVRQGSGLGLADLAGEFIYYEMGYELHTWTSRRHYRFDGLGTGTYYVTGDSDGQTIPARGNFAYTVDSSGNVSIDGQPLGVISANGEYLVFADTAWADASPGISLGIGVKTTHVSRDQIGAYRQGEWYRDINENGDWEWEADFYGYFGTAAMTPLAGDWNGSGQTRIGAYVGGAWYLDLNGNGLWDGEPTDRVVAAFGDASDFPVVGDWNGDGRAKIGIYRPGNFTWYLDYNGNFAYDHHGGDVAGAFGFAGCIPVVGDWSGNGRDKIGVYSNGQWYLDATGNFGWDGYTSDTYVASFGVAGMLPVVGDWNGSGLDRIGAYRDGDWYLDLDGSGAWNPALDKYLGPFGVSGMVPVVGRW